MRPLVVYLAQHEKHEGVHVVVQGLVVQEQLGQQAQILAVYLVRPAVHLEHGKPASVPPFRRLTVDLIPWGMPVMSYKSNSHVEARWCVPCQRWHLGRKGRVTSAKKHYLVIVQLGHAQS